MEPTTLSARLCRTLFVSFHVMNERQVPSNVNKGCRAESRTEGRTVTSGHPGRPNAGTVFEGKSRSNSSDAATMLMTAQPGGAGLTSRRFHRERLFVDRDGTMVELRDRRNFGWSFRGSRQCHDFVTRRQFSAGCISTRHASDIIFFAASSGARERRGRPVEIVVSNRRSPPSGRFKRTSCVGDPRAFVTAAGTISRSATSLMSFGVVMTMRRDRIK